MWTFHFLSILAPLIGHIQSVKSTNEQPAPGKNEKEKYFIYFRIIRIISNWTQIVELVFCSQAHYGKQHLIDWFMLYET